MCFVLEFLCEGVYFLKAAPKFVFWFTLDKMNDKFTQIMESYVKVQPKLVPFNIPKVNSSKMQIPKLNKL